MKKAEETNAYYNKTPEKMHVYDASESVQNMPVKKTEESHKECSPGEFGMNKEGIGKRAGWYTEVLGSAINPLNVIGNPAGALAAYLTPTRSIQDQAKADRSTWSNVLIPGKGAYNRWKRLGLTMRGPEINQARQDLRQKKTTPDDAPEEKPEPAVQSKAASAFSFGQFVGRSLKS